MKNFRLRIQPKLLSTAHKALDELGTPSREEPYPYAQHRSHRAAVLMVPSCHWVFAHVLHALSVRLIPSLAPHLGAGIFS